jgi:hypothetical protein
MVLSFVVVLNGGAVVVIGVVVAARDEGAASSKQSGTAAAIRVPGLVTKEIVARRVRAMILILQEMIFFMMFGGRAGWRGARQGCDDGVIRLQDVRDLTAIARHFRADVVRHN